MIQGRTILAIIPARGGSKRLPGKNLKDLCGKPLIRWTLDEALQSKVIDTLVVSTDDQAIIGAVAGRGAQIVERPPYLAGDQSSVYDAIFHATDHFAPHDYVMLLQPTSPLRLAEDIDDCAYVCAQQHAPSCITVSPERPVANGAVYIAWTTWLREFRNFDGGRTAVSVMPAERSVDVDTMEDFRRAERLLTERLTERAA